MCFLRMPPHEYGIMLDVIKKSFCMNSSTSQFLSLHTTVPSNSIANIIIFFKNVISVKWHEVKTCDDSILCIIEIIGGTIIKCMKGEKKSLEVRDKHYVRFFLPNIRYIALSLGIIQLRCLYIFYDSLTCIFPNYFHSISCNNKTD